MGEVVLMSRFSRQAQRIETDWLRSLREAAKERLTPKSPPPRDDSRTTLVEEALEIRRRRFSRPAPGEDEPAAQD